jgi:hypothetical protein
MGYDPLTPLLRLSRPYNPSGLAPYRPPPRKFFTKCPFAMHFREIFISRGGGAKNFDTQNDLSENISTPKSYADDGRSQTGSVGI